MPNTFKAATSAANSIYAWRRGPFALVDTGRNIFVEVDGVSISIRQIKGGVQVNFGPKCQEPVIQHTYRPALQVKPE